MLSANMPVESHELACAKIRIVIRESIEATGLIDCLFFSSCITYNNAILTQLIKKSTEGGAT